MECSFFENQPGRKNLFAFLCRKPLYGSECAPLGRFVAIAAVLRKAGYYQHRLDMCVFPKRGKSEEGGSPCAILIIHVGDILMCGTASELQYFAQTIQHFDTGEILSLQVGKKFAFC